MKCSVCKRDYAAIPYGPGYWQCLYCGSYSEPTGDGGAVYYTRAGTVWGSYDGRGQRYDASGNPVEAWS